MAGVTTRAKASTSVLVISLLGVAAYVVALVEHAVVAKVFGASAETDAYFIASIIPQLVKSIFLATAISASLIHRCTLIGPYLGEMTGPVCQCSSS